MSEVVRSAEISPDTVSSITVDQWWSTTPKGIKFEKKELRRFLSKNGWMRLIKSKTEYTPIQIINGVVSEVAVFAARDYLIEYLESHDLNDVLDAFLNDSGVVDSDLLEILEPIKIDFSRDTNETARFFFANGIVVVAGDNIQFVPYKEFDGYVWDNKIIQHNFNPTKSIDSDFAKFINNVAGSSEEKRENEDISIDTSRVKALKSIIGYMLHNYKDRRIAKAIVLMDSKLDSYGDANGGTGKGLLAQAISKCRQMVTKDCKHTKPGSSRFFYQDYSEGTDIMFFDDLNMDFDFSALFPAITEGIMAEKKYKNSNFIPFEVSPKLLLSTNYALQGPSGSSMARRVVEFELSDYYGIEHTPEEDFNNILFDGWNIDEWNQFYSFMFECVQVYLTNGILPAPQINITAKRIICETSVEFSDFAKTNIEIGHKYNALHLYIEYSREVKDGTSRHMFTKWISKYAAIRNLKCIQLRSDGQYFFTLMGNSKVEKSVQIQAQLTQS